MKLRIAIIGCGAIAADLHLPAAARSQHGIITAVVDPDLARAKFLADKFRIPLACQQLAEVQGQADAVLLATPPHVRVSIVREALQLGLHVLCEKPLANTVAECEELVRMAESSHCVTAAAHVYRFWPARERLAQAFRDGEFGRPLRAFVSQGNVYSWPSVTGYTVRKEMVPGGVLINAGIHPLDTLLWWFGELETFHYVDDALGGLESNCDLKMKFRSGVESQLVMSRTTKLKHVIRIETETCVIDLPTYLRHEFYVYEGQAKRTVRVAESSDDTLLPAISQLDDFALAVLQSTGPRVTFAEGMRVIELIEHCYTEKRSRSLPKHAPVPGALW